MIGPAGHEIQDSSYSPKKTKWMDIGNYSIFLVDGEEIRSNQAIDFTQGGHHKVFPFIPEGEVWIERMKDPREQYYTLVHELKEIKDMQKESYDTAHPKANEAELEVRKEAAVREILKDLVAGAFSGLGSGLAAGVAVILYDKLQKDRKKRERKLSALADIAMLANAYRLKKEAGWFKRPPRPPQPSVVAEMHKAIPQMSMGKLLTANTLALLVAAGLMGVAEGAGMNAYEWGKEKYLKPPVMPEPEMKDPSIEI